MQRLAAANDPLQAGELAAAIDDWIARPRQVRSGLLVRAGTDSPTAATWVYSPPGCTARLWPPEAAAPAFAPLIRAAADWSARAGLRLVQAFMDPSDTTACDTLAANGFPWLVDLLYMMAPVPDPGLDASGPGALSFESLGQDPTPRLVNLLDAVRADSRDCPELDTVLTTRETLEAFAGGLGPRADAGWRVARHNGEDVGLLLLSPHAHGGPYELTFMGVVPAWRGHGIGAGLVCEALRQAAAAGASHLLLSVDARNRPARGLYERHALVVRARRRVHAWTADP